MLFGMFNADLVVFGQYLAITKQKIEKMYIKEAEKTFFYFYKKRIRARGGSAKVEKTILDGNVINFAKVVKGGGGKTLIHQKWIICSLF